MTIYKKWISVALWITIALLIWQGAAYLLDQVLSDPLAGKKVPYLWDIGASFNQYSGELIAQAGVTLSRAGLGFLIGSGVGILLALSMSISRIVEKTALPYLLLSQMIPILGLAPIIFGLVKDIDSARLIIAAYITFFPVSVSFLSGLKSVDKDKKMLMASYAASKWQTYRKLMIPFSLPYLFTGLKIAAPLAVTASILVDTLSAKDGIGYTIILSLYGGGTAGKFWPAVLIASLMGVISFIIMSLLEKIIIPWKRYEESGGQI